MSGLLEGGISQKDEDAIRAEAKAERTREIASECGGFACDTPDEVFELPNYLRTRYPEAFKDEGFPNTQVSHSRNTKPQTNAPEGFTESRKTCAGTEKRAAFTNAPENPAGAVKGGTGGAETNE